MILKGSTLLLDMDGVIAEVSQSYRAAIIKTCHFYEALSVTFETIAQRKAKGGCNNDWALSLDLIRSDPNGRQDVTLDEVTETFEMFYQGDESKNISGLYRLETLIPDLNLLKELRKRCSGGMGIVTGRPRKDCEKFLSLFDIQHLFDVCVCMEDGPLKPHPFPVLHACEKLGVSPSQQVLMVGDTPDDIRAAVGAGVTAVGVVTPDSHANALKEGKPFDSCLLSTAMKECGARYIMEPGFERLLDFFPE
jgi:HAD superfamily hydrolase (TIGR01548 family)